jgi:hypothetical protein
MNERERATITGTINEVSTRDGKSGKFVALDVQEADTGSRLTIRAFTDRSSTFPDKKQSQALKLQEGDVVSLMVDVQVRSGQTYHNLVQVTSTEPTQPKPRQAKAQLPRGNGDSQRNSIERQTASKGATDLTASGQEKTREKWDEWFFHIIARIQDTQSPIYSNGGSEEWHDVPIDESMMPDDEDVLGFV